MSKVYKDAVFGRWTVLGEAMYKKGNRYFLCQCSCKDKTSKWVSEAGLLSGKSKSCGCWNKESLCSKKYHNTYIFNYDKNECIGYDKDKNFSFTIDLEDYELMKNYSWYRDKKDGYWRTAERQEDGTVRRVAMHRFIMGAKKQEVIDHKDRNPSNNHKSNLRFCTAQENSRNVSLSSRNSSGFLGVYWKEKKKHWEASIKIDGKDKYLGSFKNKDDAIKARLLGEKEYYGEFAPQRNLFEQYGIV